MDPELLLQRSQSAFQRADYASRDPGGMPVHAHHGPQRLEPEGVGETPQELIAAVMMDNRFADTRPEARHSVGEPLGYLSSVQRQVGGSSPLGHRASSKNT